MNLKVRAELDVAQQSVIGSMLIDDRCVGNVMAAIGPEDFPSGTCKSTFFHIRKLFLEGRPIDPVVVINAMQGGEAYTKWVTSVMDLTPTAANVLQYCEIVKTATRLLRINDIAAALAEAQAMDDAEGLVAQINSLMVSQTDKRVVSAQDMMLHFMQRMESDEKPEYIKTGIAGLDGSTFLELGDMVGIGAAPSAGKTAFALQWAIQLATKYRVGFYSLETHEEKVADRMVASESGVDLPDIKKRVFQSDVWDKLASATSKIAGLSLNFVQASDMSASSIVSEALARRHQIIFVDYLQIVPGDRKHRDGRYDVVTEASMTFHRAAANHKILTVLLSQLSRPSKNKDGQPIPPSMHSFRESGQIEQDLDLALLMYQADPDNFRSDRLMKIGKNKEGTKATVTLTFDGAHQTFAQAKVSTYAQLKEIGKQAAKEGKPGEADETGLKDSTASAWQVLEGEELPLPF